MRKFLFLLAIIAVLFVSSSQTYEQQSIVPTLQTLLPDKPMENQLAKLQIPYWGKTISVEERGYYYFVEFLLRKSAHFFIFGLLALAVYYVLPKFRLRTITAFIITVGFAMADEYHQSLTGGRTATIQDVILDASGAFTFLLIFRLIYSAVMSLKRRRKLARKKR
ncbi:VanZ family protein [Sporosarcina sp. Sa2YVA2]|uniref:VanZ family protein n=1 Tax=Sporosarcina quadrami TaxID=2762234 RepID=A0ABR8UA18_9BACL|nr:VanZ family protein [Sporosarcina quadrami]MBD7984861.1 VanZ family protein [Sporosarcina quadrami]